MYGLEFERQKEIETKQSIFKLIMERFSQKVPLSVIESFFDDAKVVDFLPTVVIFYIPEFKRSIVAGTYLSQLTESVQELYGNHFSVEFIDDPNVIDHYSTVPTNLYDNYTFDNFIVGNCNKFAHANAEALAKHRSTDHNPVFIWGDSGLGKTHLLYAIYNFVKSSQKELNVKVITAENFTNEMIDAIRTGKQMEFRARYRPVNMLFIDDIQFIGGKDFAMEELFNTFNELYMQNNHLVFTSDRPPKDIPALTDRLRSRFESGILADIEPPDFETRVAIIEKKAFTLGFRVPKEISYHIANNIKSNVRQLEGAVKKIMSYHQIMDEPLTMETAEKSIRDLLSEDPGLNPTPEHIIKHVCDFTNITHEEVLSVGRRGPVIHARQLAIYLIRSLTDMSYTEIARIFNRDHTTIAHAINQIDKKKTGELQKEINLLISNIRG